MPRGQPSLINRVVDVRVVDGLTINITVADQIVAALRAGNFLEPSIAAAGVGKETVYGWLRTAGKARLRASGGIEHANLTDHERRCIEFSDAVTQADATWEVLANTTLERLSRGGIPKVVETVKFDRDEHVIERITRTTHTLPDARVIQWRLKHRFPTRYSDRVELGGAEHGHLELSMEERARAMLDMVRAFKARRRLAAGSESEHQRG